jgi:hypothetical protein
MLIMKTGATIMSLVLLISCGSMTSISKSWKDPSVSISMTDLHKMLVVAFLRNEQSRKLVEDRLVARLKGKGVPSYSYIGDLKDKGEEIRQKLVRDSFGGVIVMRLLDVDKQVNYIQGGAVYPSYYGNFATYYASSWNGFYQPGYYEQNKVYTVETNVYSVGLDKLVWSGVTTTPDPTKLDKTIDEIADVVAKEMRRQKFIVD